MLGRRLGAAVHNHATTDDSEVILAFIPAVDNYLFATILLIISMNLYELFVSQIDPEWRGHLKRPSWLAAGDLGHVTSRIGEVIIMMLIVKFFEKSFTMSYVHAIDALVLGGAVLLIAGALGVA